MGKNQKKQKEERSIIKIPDYYIGKLYGYEARKIIDDYQLSYHIGSAVAYLLRAENKHKEARDCIRKAIHHLYYEIEKKDLEEGGSDL